MIYVYSTHLAKEPAVLEVFAPALSVSAARRALQGKTVCAAKSDPMA